MSSRLILCGQLHRPNVFQDSPKIRLRREALGSISVQEGQPQILPISPRIFGFGNCWNSDEDPAYCDVIVQRWQTFTDKAVVLEADGRTFDELAASLPV
jgi:hypothetical protein